MSLRLITNLLAIPLFLFGFQSSGQGLPANFNFDGFLTDDYGTPLDGTTNLSFEIYNPSEDCLLYKEDHTYNVDQGHFSVKIGTGTRISGSIDGGAAFKDIFQNSTIIRAIDATYCPSEYIPSAGDSRKLKVLVNGNALNPLYELSSVPTATVAETLQGQGPSDFISAITPDLQQLSGPLQTSSYIQVGDSAIACDGSLPGGIQYSSGSLQYCNGSNWETLGTAGGGVTSINTGTGLTGGPITSSGTLAVDVGTSADQILQLNASAQIPAVSGALLTNLNASNLTSGTVPTARMPTMSGDVTSAAGSGVLTLADSGVTAGVYGSTNQIPIFTVDNKGRVTDASMITIDPAGSNLSNGKIWIGNGSNMAAAATMYGDAALANTGALTIANDAITTAKIGDGQVTDAKIASGISAAKLIGSLPSMNGANLNNLNASQITTGTLNPDRLPNSIGTSGAVNLALQTNNTTRMTIHATTGNVGIGTTNPEAQLHVNGGAIVDGAIVGGFYENGTVTNPATHTIYWSEGNVQSVEVNCSSPIELDNMRAGGIYKLIMTKTTTTGCTFTHSGFTPRYPSGTTVDGIGHGATATFVLTFTATDSEIFIEANSVITP